VHADTDVVSLGMGGNDVGFVGLATDCIRVTLPPAQPPCTPGPHPGKPDPVSAKIAATGIELGKAIRDIHAKAPHAAILIVGYPDAFPDSGEGYWLYVPILNQDMPYLVARFKEMNAMEKAAAEANGATYVDIYTPSIGHDACQVPALAWVNAAVLVP